MRTGTHEKLSNVDAAWLRMDSPANAMVINAALLFADTVSYAEFAHIFEQRLLPHARFRQQVADADLPFKAPHWRDDTPFDLRLHLHHLRLPSPGDADALATLLSDLASAPLPRDRPLWQAYVIDDVEGGTMLFVRIHHAVGDGIALVRLLLSLCDENVHPPAPVGVRSVHTTGALHRGKRMVEQASTLARLLLLPEDSQSPLRGELGLRKRVAWAGPVLLSDVRSVAEAIDGTVHDVLQSCVAGALHRYLAVHDGLPPSANLRTMVTVYLRDPSHEHGLGNHFSLVFLDLPVGHMAAMERLRLVKDRMDKLKRAEDATVAFAVLDVLGRANGSLEQLALEEFTRKATLVTTNVPGPPEPASFAGHRLRSLLVWAPTAACLGLGFTLVSYGQDVMVGILADAHRVPNPATLVAAFEAEFAELVQWTREHKAY